MENPKLPNAWENTKRSNKISNDLFGVSFYLRLAVPALLGNAQLVADCSPHLTWIFPLRKQLPRSLVAKGNQAGVMGDDLGKISAELVFDKFGELAQSHWRE